MKIKETNNKKDIRIFKHASSNREEKSKNTIIFHENKQSTFWSNRKNKTPRNIPLCRERNNQVRSKDYEAYYF